MTAIVEQGRALLARRWQDGVMLGTPVFVYFAVQRFPDELLQRGIIAFLFILLLTFLAARPGPAAVALIGGFAVMEIVLPLLFKWGMPVAVVRGIGFWKEGLVAALVVAAFRYRRRHPTRPDAIDWFGASFVVLVTLYWLVPRLFIADPIEVVGSARQVAFRSLILPVIGLVAVRHAGIPDHWRRRCMGATMFVGVLLATGGVVEVLAPEWWDNFLSRTIGLLPYRNAVFEESRTTVLTHAQFGRSNFQRSGSLYADPLITGFTYHLPLAVALAVAIRRPQLRTIAVLGFAATGLLVTQGRAAILGGVVIVVLALRGSDDQSAATRTKLGLAVAGVAIVALPLLAGTALGVRVAGAVNGKDTVSAPDHIERSTAAFEKVMDEPLGSGLGLSGGNSQRFGVEEGVLSENHFLAIGIEVGVLGMALFVLLLGATIRAGRRGIPDTLGFAATSALTATAIGGLFLHSLESPVISVPALVAAGLATTAHVSTPPADVRRPAFAGR